MWNHVKANYGYITSSTVAAAPKQDMKYLVSMIWRTDKNRYMLYDRVVHNISPKVRELNAPNIEV